MHQDSQIVFITGAAGYLGHAVATRFLAAGSQVVLLDRDTETLRALYAARSDVAVYEAGLMDCDAVHAAVASACARFGKIDTLCHIAGGFRMGQAVHETSAETWEFLMDLNARSLLHVAAAVVPGMLAKGQGQIVTVGAGAGQRGGAHMGVYSAAKSALARLTESMSAELRDQRIRVNCVLPSILDTPVNRAAMPEADSSRWVAPEALAEVIAFLASPGARAIHGAAIPVSGTL